MKSIIENYPDFRKVVRQNELVYLFGTGISAALTGKNYSWKKWILDGTGYFSDRKAADDIAESLQKDSSTKNLLNAVKTVLAVTKQERKYDQWMHRSFEENRVTNQNLAETLKKLLITQDVFATTNYDHLLEQATGLAALSYTDTQQAFYMLDQRKSNAVLHIHGEYDSTRGIDNIIADEEQYRAILNDKGAQFLQQILGTRTLIFVGCGQTTEDANIAQVIRFARDYLHIDREYYYLYRQGEEPKGLPDFIRAIPYGEEYSDLPEFLEDMAQLRLYEKIESNPMVTRTAYTKNTMDAYGLAEYHYSRQYLKFCGRRMELAQLQNFVEADRMFLWWAVTGQGGAGKSRLALEFLKRSHRDFFGFFLNYAVDPEEVRRFKPFNDTVAIVDYVKGNEAEIAVIFAILIDKFSSGPYKLRILLLERENTTEFGSWHHDLITAMAPYYRQECNDAEYNLELSTKNHRFLYLDDLDGAAVEELIGAICEKNGLPADRYRDRRLKDEYGRKFEQLKFRPLFLQMFVEAWIANGCMAVEYDDYKSLLKNVVSREQERILQVVDHRMDVFNALIRMIICAGVAEGISVRELAMLHPAEWETVRDFTKTHTITGTQRKDFLTGLLKDASQDILEGTEVLHVLYPDIVKEYMFLYYFEEEDIREVSGLLWRNCPAEYNAFLSRCLTDFQRKESLVRVIREASADYTNANAMIVRQALLAFKVISTKEDGLYFLNRDLEEYEYWKSMPVTNELQAIYLQSMYLCVRQMLGWSHKNFYEAIDRIAFFPVNRDLSARKVQYLLETIHYLVEKNCIDSAQDIIKKTEKALREVAEGEEKKELGLSLQREIIVSDVYYKKWWDIRRRHRKIFRKVDWKKEHQSEQYAYIVFSGAQKCWETMELGGKLLMFTNWLQDYAVDYASGKRNIYFNDKSHYYYLHAKYFSTAATAMAAAIAGMDSYGIGHIDALLDELKGNMMISDFAGLLVGTRALKVRYDDTVTDEMIQGYLGETEPLLDRYPDNAILAEKAIQLWKTVYEVRYKKDVPREIVERAYVLLLRFPKDKNVMNRFLEMLEQSTERDRWQEYIHNKAVVCGMLENIEDVMSPGLRELLK